MTGTTGRLVIVTIGGLILVRVVLTGMSVRAVMEVSVLVSVVTVKGGGLMVVIFVPLVVTVKGGGLMVVIFVPLVVKGGGTMVVVLPTEVVGVRGGGTIVVVSLRPESVLVLVSLREDEGDLDGEVVMVVLGLLLGGTVVLLWLVVGVSVELGFTLVEGGRTVVVLVRGGGRFRGSKVTVSWAAATAMTLARRMGVLKRMTAERLPRSASCFLDCMNLSVVWRKAAVV
jgi:hypothetical protein